MNLDEQDRVRGHELKSEPIPTNALSSRSVADNHLQLVSIVIPTYNQAEYLAIAIDSVLEQDYPNLEIIVVDDGSTDGTPKVLDRYKDRVTCVRQDNGGQSRALNRGWSMSQGDLLGYLSSDDLLLPHAISELVDTLARNPSSVLTYCDFELIDGKGAVVRRVQTEPFNEHRMTVDLVCLPGPGALFRRDAFMKGGGWREDLRQCPDFEFWLRISKYGIFVRAENCLAQYRIHSESASFRPISVERSDELISVVHQHWETTIGKVKYRAFSRAYLNAARNHAQSGRQITALLRLFLSIWFSPRTFIKVEAWRIVVGGFFRRIYYASRA